MRLSFRHKRMTLLTCKSVILRIQTPQLMDSSAIMQMIKKLEEMDTTSGEYKSVE